MVGYVYHRTPVEQGFPALDLHGLWEGEHVPEHSGTPSKYAAVDLERGGATRDEDNVPIVEPQYVVLDRATSL